MVTPETTEPSTDCIRQRRYRARLSEEKRREINRKSNERRRERIQEMKNDPKKLEQQRLKKRLENQKYWQKKNIISGLVITKMPEKQPKTGPSADCIRQRRFRARMTEEKRQEINRKSNERRRQRNKEIKKDPTKLELQRMKKRHEKQKYKERKNIETGIVNISNKFGFGKGIAKIKKEFPEKPKVIKTIVKNIPDLKTQSGTSNLISFSPVYNVTQERKPKPFKTFQIIDQTSCPHSNEKRTVKKEENYSKPCIQTSYKQSIQMFQEKHPDIRIGQTSFRRYRLQNLSSFHKAPRRDCTCKYHDDVFYLLESLSKFIPEIFREKNIENFINLVACDSNNVNCMKGACSNCLDRTGEVLQLVSLDDIDREIQWKYWERVNGKDVLLQKAGTVKEAVEDICKKAKEKFKFHHYVKRIQQNIFASLKLNSNQYEAVLEVNFAELQNSTILN
ncbi:CLUMA_CG017508, isoform A [Clunio marinus]|uniref:CLUMA_CG017508, isoform A n=1 Tax=Clunio marinus TaxID=568069 RepID=A0A1J1IZ30_9DIPT|nr:CLUMA_CG017508, isoform A [Clunio marinus]